MNITLFLILFTICEVITPLVVQGFKMIFDSSNSKYNGTILALITSIIVSGIAGVFTYMSKGIPFNDINIFYIVFLMGANWLGATLGYDKVKQALTNIKDTK